MKIKHPFKVNQVWISKIDSTRSFFITQIYCTDSENSLECNDTSYIIFTLIDDKKFYEKVAKYQEEHHITDRSVTNPFCIFGEYKINSLKQYIRKYPFY